MQKMVKNVPAVQKPWLLSTGQEDPLGQEVATHSRIPAWGNPVDRGAHRVAEPDTSEASSLHTPGNQGCAELSLYLCLYLFVSETFSVY